MTDLKTGIKKNLIFLLSLFGMVEWSFHKGLEFHFHLEYFFNILSALEIEPIRELQQIKQLLETDSEG